MPLKNYTTKVPAFRSINEIQQMLQNAGVSGIMTEFEQGTGKISHISFKIAVEGQIMAFKLPLKWREAQKVLINQGVRKAQNDEEYAYRVAWRLLRNWLEQQLALHALDMVQMQEIFLPYIITKSGQTLYEVALQDPSRLLGSGKND